MVVQNTVRTHRVNQVFRFVEGIWLHRKSREIQFFLRKRLILLHTCTTCSELPSYISTMDQTDCIEYLMEEEKKCVQHNEILFFSYINERLLIQLPVFILYGIIEQIAHL